MRGHPRGFSFRRVTVVLAVGLVASLASFLVPTPAGAVIVGAPSNATVRAGNEDESAVAVNPNNTKQIAVMTNGIVGDAGLPLSFSTDGGLTWTRTVFATGTGPGGDGRPVACCDPTLSWDDHGNLFVGYLQRNPRTIELYVTNDLGANFTNLGPVDTGAAGSLDQPTVVAGENSVWVTWRDDSGGIAVRGRSVTGALTFGAWNAEQDVSNVGNFGDIAIGPTGEVMVTYESPTAGQGPATIFTHTDADGLGAGAFGAAVTATTTNVGGFDFLPAQPQRSVDAEPGLAWDRTGGANNDRVYLVYTEEGPPNENNDFDILVRTSTNDGATWSAPVQVNDDAGTNSQMLPRIALDQTSGVVGVSFYDARLDTGGGPSASDIDGTANNDVTLFASASTNGGATWGTNFPIADAPTNGYALNGAQELGDYTGLAFHAGIMYPSWADSSNSTGDNPDGTNAGLDVYVAAFRPLLSPTNLRITKACAPTPVVPGATVTCQLTVTNLGPSDAPDVVVTDTLPAGLSVVSPPVPSGAGFTCNILGGGSQLRCTKPTQANGATTVITYTVRVADTVGPSVTLNNSATVASQAASDTAPADNTATASITTVSCTIASNGAQIAGTPGNDVICGGLASQDITGLAGNDVIFGSGGDDRITGGDGDDTLLGGDGADQLAGVAGNDHLFGQVGADYAAGGVGTDECVAENEAACEI